MTDRPIIVWFRRDLRVADNPALLSAAGSGRPVVPVYVTDWERDDRWRPGAAGRWWLEASLRHLAEALEALGAPLVSLPGTAEEAIPDLARLLGSVEVVWNRLYEPYSREVEGRVAAALARDGVTWHSFNAALLFEPDGQLSRSGKPFVQFTAYWRSYLASPGPEPPVPGPQALRGMPGLPAAITSASRRRRMTVASDWAPEAGAEPSWRPGEEGALGCLAGFEDCCLAGYERDRDIPGVQGTSRLSPHLHFGELGPRQVWESIRSIEAEDRSLSRADGRRDRNAGAEAFLRQLMWREFAYYLLFHFPWIAEHPFRPEFAGFPWQEDPVGLEAWKWGTTGYPLVDAGSRQLLATGWMHNRVRMVSASFLTKDLLIPWQEGAAWFWDRLVDADLANNTLGWQWTAGSGPDAAPYFRVFNPELQALRFDKDGAYVRRWVAGPERARIVEHGEARARALAAFHGLRAGPPGH